MAAVRPTWEKIRLAMSRADGDAKPPVCPLCLTSVRDEDAVGLVGDRVGHAECALVTWIGSGDELRDAVSAAGRPR